jgi:putative glycerol-1-phosphate prenyltransferase
MTTDIYDKMLNIRAQKGAGFIVLIDPDDLPSERAPKFLADCEAAGVDAFFLGGSLMHVPWLDKYVAMLKQFTSLPVIGFPGSLNQVSGHLDAILYLSVISGRNPDYLFGQHVIAAPILKRLKLETISTGYMLIESGQMTAAQYMSNSIPIPRNKANIAVATALAAEMMGMKMLFTDAGSGAEKMVREDMITAISRTCSIPLVVGGGIKSPYEVANRVQAGASFVVIGDAIEKNSDRHYIEDLAAAAHSRLPVKI